MPRNPLSGTKYRGLNIAMLWGAGEACGYCSQLWATYNQWRDAGAQVRKGEKSTLIFFWKQVDARDGAVREDEDGRKVVFVFLSAVLRPFLLVAFLEDRTGEAGALPAAGITQIGWKHKGGHGGARHVLAEG